jgi:hypothetical protein
MDNFNVKNMQLAYQAIYDQNLCESMEELGLIGEGNSEQDQFKSWVNELLDEGYDLSDYTWDELYEGYKKLPVGKMIKQAVNKGVKANLKHAGVHPALRPEMKETLQKTEGDIKKMVRVADRHSLVKGKGKVRGEGQAELNRRKGEMKEDYDAYDLVLEYLLDEGFADTLEGAEAIMVNMSEEWIEGIFEERAPGVKPYQPRPTQAEVRANARAAAKKKASASADKTGYGPDEKFYKPEDKKIPDAATAQWFRTTIKKFGRPTGKYNPGTIKTQDILDKMPENSPGAKPKPRRVIPSRLDRAPKG